MKKAKVKRGEVVISKKKETKVTSKQQSESVMMERVRLGQASNSWSGRHGSGSQGGRDWLGALPNTHNA